MKNKQSEIISDEVTKSGETLHPSNHRVACTSGSFPTLYEHYYIHYIPTSIEDEHKYAVIDSHLKQSNPRLHNPIYNLFLSIYS